jgi:thiamine pyrophosphokinase
MVPGELGVARLRTRPICRGPYYLILDNASVGTAKASRQLNCAIGRIPVSWESGFFVARWAIATEIEMKTFDRHEPGSETTQRNVTVWVLAAGPHRETQSDYDRLPRPDYAVAADGGSMLAARLGLTPDLVIGDLDSADPDLITRWQDIGIEMRRYKHSEKWETDTELALLAALQWQPSTIFVLGAIGGRLDHEMANILLLTHPTLMPLDIRLVDGTQELFLAKPGRWNAITGEPRDTVSLLPLGGDADGVETEGLEYPLRRETLQQGKGRGVSNTMLAGDARVRHESGLMLVVHLHNYMQQNEQGGTQ